MCFFFVCLFKFWSVLSKASAFHIQSALEGAAEGMHSAFQWMCEAGCYVRKRVFVGFSSLTQIKPKKTNKTAVLCVSQTSACLVLSSLGGTETSAG